ncbi:hypothetical protein [uncultured Gimesia sp.]|jgi:hypothetical protein|uniref:hypothetical protein n=1 Tax=uncultured Gimesia sp. TaxID=1678688 RepID=UPI00262307D6|nr:hypothetical protein [uncultured Gimesia sp.]
MNHLTITVRTLLTLLLFSTSVTGCTSLALSSWNWKTAKNFATPKKPAVEIVALWEPAEGKGVDGLPTRGFAGQILFFQHNNSSPVYAKGEVMVYLYDDQGDLKEQSKPLHQYKFDSGAWQVHAVESTLGPAYQVFIPYVRKGRDQAECALRVQLTQKDAPDIYSRMISVKLEGKTPQVTEESLTQQPEQKAKANVEVDTLARRETGKRLELSSKHKQSQLRSSEADLNRIQQVKAEVMEPVVDERDERIRQLESQMYRLLNDPKQLPAERSRQYTADAIPTESGGYRQFRLNDAAE